jgi:hypothetical protein
VDRCEESEIEKIGVCNYGRESAKMGCGQGTCDPTANPGLFKRTTTARINSQIKNLEDAVKKVLERTQGTLKRKAKLSYMHQPSEQESKPALSVKT